MTDPLTAWEARRATCHTFAESTEIGDALAEEVKRLRGKTAAMLYAIESADLLVAYEQGHRIHFDDLQEFFWDEANKALQSK